MLTSELLPTLLLPMNATSPRSASGQPSMSTAPVTKTVRRTRALHSASNVALSFSDLFSFSCWVARSDEKGNFREPGNENGRWYSRECDHCIQHVYSFSDQV